MAILKHFAVKNADYGAVIDYLKYQHDEFHLVPILDENGNSMLRDEFYFDGLNCNPEAFDLECELLNQQYHKNQRYDEIKCHHYIISHDPMDVTDHGLTGEQAQAIGMEYAKANFPGHQALVCTHTDGSNNSGNIHTHIIINSLRKEDIASQPYAERAIDCKAGYKHHLTKEYLRHLQGSLMDICQREGLYQVDLLSPAAEKITQQEYHAHRRGQLNLDMANMEIMAEGIAPMKTKFETNKEKIRNAINDIAERAKSFEEFQRLLKAEYGIQVKDHRERFSYLTSDRQKYISARKLGSHYDREYLLQLFEENALAAEQNQAQWVPDDPITILFIKSDLRLVVDLQSCIKAQQSRAYAQKVKISNLQQMAKTVIFSNTRKIKCNQRVCCYIQQPRWTAVMLHIRQFFNICQCSKNLWTTNTDFVEVEIFIMLLAFSVYTRCNQIARIIDSTVKECLLFCIWISTVFCAFYFVCVVIELYRKLLYKC